MSAVTVKTKFNCYSFIYCLDRQRNDANQKNQILDNQDHGDTDYRLGGPGAPGTAQNSNAPAPVPPPPGSSNTNSDSRPSFPGRNTRRCRDYDGDFT